MIIQQSIIYLNSQSHWVDWVVAGYDEVKGAPNKNDTASAHLILCDYFIIFSPVDWQRLPLIVSTASIAAYLPRMPLPTKPAINAEKDRKKAHTDIKTNWQ